MSELTEAILIQRDNIEKQENRTFINNREAYIKKLENQLQQKESIIKEVREKIKEFCWDYEYETYSNMTNNKIKELVELLDKEVNCS